MTSRQIVLASGSPRRRELLALLGMEFTLVAPDLDETPYPGERAVQLVDRLAHEKAVTVAAAYPDAVVVGADTSVELDGELFGKPADADDARRMLRALSGRTHVVHSGVAVAADGGVATARTSSDVAFAVLTDGDIEWYVGTGEPFDKAGAYALQGAGGVFVTTLSGSVSGVLGLPLHETAALLRRVR
jgi:nucleoside triphosphate pyrophosphatase